MGRQILPWFGGAAAAWVACLLFFQIGVVAGYAYAHLLSRALPPKTQAWLHLTLLAGAITLLPIALDPAGAPGPGEGSPGQVLFLLASTIGLPYGLLAATGPLLQRWYAAELPGRSPYRLYALSNAASLVALALYPFVIEPVLGLARQVTVWSWLFAVFALATGWCAALVIQGAGRVAIGPPPAASPATSDQPPPGAGRMATWVALSAAGAAMLMATTNQLTQEATGFPFVWLVPLSLYLLTLMVCFDHERWYDRRVFMPLLAVAVPLAVATLVAGTRAMFWGQLAVYACALTACCMVVHGELVRLRPSPRHLTAFYLAIAVGGALGGALVSLGAPLVFRGYWELHVSLAACLVLALGTALDHRPTVPRPGFMLAMLAAVLTVLAGLLAAVVLLRFGWDRGLAFEDGDTVRGHLVSVSLIHRKYLVMAGAAAFIAGIGLVGDWLNARAGSVSRWYVYALPGAALMVPVALLTQMADANRRSIHAERNFYGVLRVIEWAGRTETESGYRELVHGHINHGTQFLDPELEWTPTAYYGRESGIGLALDHRRRRAAAGGGGAPLRVGVVGLGIGTLATYGEPDDVLRFYELDPAVARLARRYFTYLERSPARLEIVIGDARRQMEAELGTAGAQPLDVLAVDAFLGDAIPVHLLTREAVAVYLRHLAHDGLLALHLSNRLLDLRPLARGLAATYGLRAALVRTGGRPDAGTFDATWVVLARPDNPFFADTTVARALTPWPESVDQRATVWTDDYSSIWRLFRRAERPGT